LERDPERHKIHHFLAPYEKESLRSQSYKKGSQDFSFFHE
jgi:hypothetical protein